MKLKNIPGIYNYCDRWCERCAFTNRCLSFQRGEIRKIHWPKPDDDPFNETISRNIEDALDFMMKASNKNKNGEDDWSYEENEAWAQKRHKTAEVLKAHELTSITREYSNKTLDLLERRPRFKEKQLGLIRQIQMGLRTPEDTMEEVKIISDHLEIVEYYVHFIYVKFQRALRGMIENDGWEESQGYQRDFDGSAKIALIATDKCIEAWIKINELMPGNDDEILYLLGLLQKIKRMGEEEFPKARSFLRPGFDDHLVEKKKRWLGW